MSFLVHHDFKTPVPGLDKVPRSDWPPVALTFTSFRLMVGMGFLFVALTAIGAFFRWRGTLFEKRWLLWVFVLAVPLPYIANQLGWIAAEVGRQPWVVYGLLRTGDALSKVVAANQVLYSLVMFGVIYLALFALWLYVLLEKIQQGPEPVTGGAQ